MSACLFNSMNSILSTVSFLIIFLTKKIICFWFTFIWQSYFSYMSSGCELCYIFYYFPIMIFFYYIILFYAIVFWRWVIIRFYTDVDYIYILTSLTTTWSNNLVLRSVFSACIFDDDMKGIVGAYWVMMWLSFAIVNQRISRYIKQ